MINNKVLVVQRVLTHYRFDLLQELAPSVSKLAFATSQGDKEGTLKSYLPKELKYNNIEIVKLNAFKLNYKGESRGTSLFFYPQILKEIKNYDTIVLEGTTNLLNNVFIIPWAKLLGKKVLWWDAGYSLNQRTFKRKVIDRVVSPFIRMTNAQLAYSTKAQKYMQSHMGAKNCHLLLNTINTDYFENIQDEINKNLKNYRFDNNHIKFLYVGVIEERKRVRELIELVHQMNQKENRYELCVIGGGEYLMRLKEYVSTHQISSIEFTGPIYDNIRLKKYYFSSDIFVLPGDGGLGILQSLLYGLPTVCLAADGTEEDYMSSQFVLNNLEDIKTIDIEVLREKFNYEELYHKVNSRKYIDKLIKVLND